jgi:hypothetical protein
VPPSPDVAAGPPADPDKTGREPDRRSARAARVVDQQQVGALTVPQVAGERGRGVRSQTEHLALAEVQVRVEDLLATEEAHGRRIEPARRQRADDRRESTVAFDQRSDRPTEREHGFPRAALSARPSPAEVQALQNDGNRSDRAVVPDVDSSPSRSP